MTRHWRPAAALLGAAALALAAHAQPLQLHVPSPDWRDQILYFVLTDRFDDGDPSNNDQGAGEYQPGSRAHYNGGDFAGLQRRLDYIRGLGATALWITPPVANLWWDGSYSGYHGYWAQNFLQVDQHLGTLDDYKALSHALHSQGMHLVQDIVLNHTGNFFGYGAGWQAGQPARGYRPNGAARPTAAPTQPPFDLNDPRNPAHRRAGIYHWTPDIVDYKNPQQLLNWQMSGLDDLNLSLIHI
jgi:glycosidase